MAPIASRTHRPSHPLLPQHPQHPQHPRTDGHPTASHAPAPPLPARVGGVAVVRWPEEHDRREALSLQGDPCLLVVDAEAPAPVTGLLEDWVRAPAALDELEVRSAAVQRRAGCGEVPTLDEGLLLHRGAWAAIPPGQVAMVELLLERIGRPVRKEELAAAANAAGASSHHDAVKAGMNRLAQRVAPLGLELRGVRGTGWVLQVADGCALHAPVSAANAKG